MQARRKQTPKMRLCHHVSVTVLDVDAAILAGGLATRFGGRDKCRLLVDGRAIIVRQIEVLQRVASRTVIIANDPARFADLDVEVQPDLVAGAGALGGLYTALASARSPYVLVVACDLPFLDERVLSRLVELARPGDGGWVRSARGVEPLLACYRAAAAPAIRRAIDAGHLKAGALDEYLRMHALDETELKTYGSPDRLLANLNSPEDLARVQ